MSELTVTAHDVGAPSVPTLMVFWPSGAVARPLVDGASVVIGRDGAADVVIADPSVSRTHVRVTRAGSQYFAEDLESSNGTYLEGGRLAAKERTSIAPGTEVRAGVARLVVLVPREIDGVPGRGPLETVQAYAKRIARGDISVLILGETGVGKDLMATLVHRESPRANGPLLRLNCAAVPEALLESELFGHEKGAFTGANATKVGLLESAARGSVFLDEVGDLSSLAQSKLLRALENREIFRVGSTSARPIDVRFIAATSRNLDALIANGTFRSDVYYRLSAAVLRIPPLRERIDEIVPLATQFLADSTARLGLPTPQLSQSAIDALRTHPWPGNIRELKNAMERAALVCDGTVLLPAHIELGARGESAPVSTASPPSVPHLKSELEDIERQRILEALEKCAGNQTRAATLLGMSRRTLLKRLDAYAIARPKKDVP